MNLVSINIKNYKTCKDIQFDINSINRSKSHFIFGINETGKSNFLVALSLFENPEMVKYVSDCNRDVLDSNKSIFISLKYDTVGVDLENILLIHEKRIPLSILSEIKITGIERFVRVKSDNSIL